ncbi:hypothetical protein DDB_G0295473 [Dictyostelium discoideum AX4]|uniref:Uncharacterized protein DDB_G0295473 n=1 Tax=Dictyostelium discoideum TaxID=44689 RepID=Y5168_DICDI|nr:hypothetical protein DDB_G0295473 [Dictyostelium discoideum AX4]B0G125.1 RecName: Full=Uncharacterized protein DDB_G0295473 [Dictyostelium discoideum]EDR41083.1 hypothetical protein DDB_G0295473 [Dictyostelium discoideum AX4]|eukprot:XP_001732987.1 hypothetical protein DDB_G0295473 [Dictyostelium discoideum AX4]
MFGFIYRDPSPAPQGKIRDGSKDPKTPGGGGGGGGGISPNGGAPLGGKGFSM